MQDPSPLHWPVHHNSCRWVLVLWCAQSYMPCCIFHALSALREATFSAQALTRLTCIAGAV